MTPDFARAVDPVFLRVLNLLERIDGDENLAPEKEQEQIQGDLHVAQGLLGQSQEWNLAKYGLVAWIDEVLIEAPWRGREWWKENSLEWDIFTTNERFEQFFLKAREASTLPERNALEVFYVCVVLGFRGLYRDPVHAPTLAEPLNLPRDLETWARQTSMAIHLRQGQPQIPSLSVTTEGAEPLEGPFMLIWSIFVGMVLAAVTGIVIKLVYFTS